MTIGPTNSSGHGDYPIRVPCGHAEEPSTSSRWTARMICEPTALIVRSVLDVDVRDLLRLAGQHGGRVQNRSLDAEDG
jgi:hypothetical protein